MKPIFDRANALNAKTQWQRVDTLFSQGIAYARRRSSLRMPAGVEPEMTHAAEHDEIFFAVRPQLASPNYVKRVGASAFQIRSRQKIGTDHFQAIAAGLVRSKHPGRDPSACSITGTCKPGESGCLRSLDSG